MANKINIVLVDYGCNKVIDVLVSFPAVPSKGERIRMTILGPDDFHPVGANTYEVTSVLWAWVRTEEKAKTEWTALVYVSLLDPATVPDLPVFPK